jgi:hypothetical protein
VRINAPQDKEIADLNSKLNGTYIAYGSRGVIGLQNQVAQDRNAASVSQRTASARAATKASSNYRNSEWDLVDALKENKVNLKDIKREGLPENMQSMSLEQRQTYIDTQATERLTIQKRIQELNTQREAFIQAELKKQTSGQNADTLGSAMNSTIRKQAMQKNFSFEQPTPAPQTSPNAAAQK